jgi:GTP-binding protein HflX
VADTVGFVRHLPHQLVESFRSTIEEAAEADLLLHVVDGSADAPAEQVDAVRAVLDEVGAADIPELIVINKCDVADPAQVLELQRAHRHVVSVSALTGEGIDELMLAIEADLPHPSVEVDVLVGYEHSALVAQVHREAEVISITHEDLGTRIQARVDEKLAEQLQLASVDTKRG